MNSVWNGLNVLLYSVANFFRQTAKKKWDGLLMLPNQEKDHLLRKSKNYILNCFVAFAKLSCRGN